MRITLCSKAGVLCGVAYTIPSIVNQYYIFSNLLENINRHRLYDIL